MAALDQIHGTRPEIARAIDAGEIDVVEILWPDHQGHPRGKRIEAEGFLARAADQGFAFCNAALTWDVAGDVKDGLRLSSWDTGYPDMFAVPDLATYRPLPWRPRTGQVVCDLVDHHGELVRTAPRTVLRRVLDRLQALGYEAR
ncbi:MAG TPA: glutamine synthetase, partial [Solirubrobacteraceae bacterium]